MTYEKVGTNLEIAREGDTLHLKLDLTQRYGLTGMGKGEIVASTRGWVQVTDTIGLSVNCVESLRKRAKR